MNAGEVLAPPSSGMELVAVKMEEDAAKFAVDVGGRALDERGSRVFIESEQDDGAGDGGWNPGMVGRQEVKQEIKQEVKEQNGPVGGSQDGVIKNRISEPVAGVKLEVDAEGPDAPGAPVPVPLARPLSQLGPPLTEKERRARERIEIDQYDVEAWTMLGNEAQSRSIADASPIYEAVLANFPTSAVYWKKFVEMHMLANNDDAVKQIFSRCLLNCLHVDLWKSYIRFMRKVNESRGSEGREELKKAYEFTLNHVGMDISAGAVWQDYISFLKGAPASTPHEESQRMTSVRKAYQRAVLAPVHLVEQLWKEYESFENAVSRALAKGLFAEYQPKHSSARAVYRERKKHCEHIDQNMLPVPPTGSYKEEQQSLAWRQLLGFEKGNPQRLDTAALIKRVAFTYEQCLMYLHHFPDAWYDFATWYAQSGLPDQAVAVFQRALKVLPDSAVLHYAYAEFEESRGSVKEAKRVYETLLSNHKTANALAHIQFMRFVRRTEGVDEARKVFLQARKAPACTFHVYVASANLELCVDKDPKVARNIFELGLKKYIHEPAYVLEYADFLERMNDDRNVRVLFERALNVLPPDESHEVWNRFLEFEQKYGDLSSMLKVEQRRKDALSSLGEDLPPASEGPLQQLISRYRFRDLWPCSTVDLDHLTRQQLMAPKAVQKLEKPSLAASGVQAVGQIDKASNTGGGASESQAAVPANWAKPDVSKMVVYDPRQGLGATLPAQASHAAIGATATLPPIMGPQSGGGFGPQGSSLHPPMAAPQTVQGALAPGTVSAQGSATAPGHSIQALRQQAPQVGLPPRPSGSQAVSSSRATVDGAVKSLDDSSKYLPAALAAFISRLPPVSGPYPDVDLVLSILVQSEVLAGRQDGQQMQGAGPGLASSATQSMDGSATVKAHTGANGMIRQGNSNQSGLRPTRQPHHNKRKELDRQEDEEDVPAAPSRPAPRDLFRLRQMQRARVGTSGSSGPAGSTSGGSGAFSGERSGSSE